MHSRWTSSFLVPRPRGRPEKVHDGIECTKTIATARADPLDLENNRISDIAPFAALCNLKSLYLANKISDISPLASLTNLTSVDLNGNELNSAAYAIHIPALESNGTVVQYDEQKPWDVTSAGIVNISDLVAVAS